MEIPLSNLLLLCIIFIVIGGVIMLLLQYLIYIKFANLPDESEEQKEINAKYTLPLNIKQKARDLKTAPAAIKSSGRLAGNSCENHQENLQGTSALISLNFVMQFLFHEFKNSNRVRKWFYRKLSTELDELISKTTTGKLLDKLTIKELELGDQFPDIRSLSVHNVELDEREQRIENLDLLLDINYVGNFSTSIDADMVLGKKGSITLKVKQLSGMARLQFTRKPYTHWSLSFLGDPELNLDIESKYQGRQMQSNITNLISNQIRKAVRRKHTLPNYKLRYKPFFHWTADEDASDSDIQPNGLLTVRVAELSRLMPSPETTDIYCTITLAPVPFIEAHQKDNRHVLISIDVIIHKAKNQQIGIVFKQSTSQIVKIESVLANTPACKSNLQAGDVVLSIEGKSVATIQQIAKAVKSLQSNVFCLRIERLIPGIIRNDAILEDLEKYDDLCDMPMSYSGSTTTKPDLDDAPVEPITKLLMVKQSSAERRTSSESSVGNTPTSSPKKAKFIAKALKKTMSRDSSDKHKHDGNGGKASRAEDKAPTMTLPERAEEVYYFYQHSTIDCPFSALIHMDDLSSYKLDANSRYLNICVYGKCAGESMLLGYNNVQIGQILGECCETSLNQSLKQIALSPPAVQAIKPHVLSNQSGFNPNLCFGDILAGFSWFGNPNLSISEANSKLAAKGQQNNQAAKEKVQDDGISVSSATAETSSLKSVGNFMDSTVPVSSTSTPAPRAHNFVRTHFQRATQCDFCGKKIWLKDAMQCGDCAMCCHKKCIAKCQNATVCGPVDCSTSLSSVSSVASVSDVAASVVPAAANPEFTITQADNMELLEPKNAAPPEDPAALPDDYKSQAAAANLDVHRSSLTGLLAQGIKRVNSASNLDIPGIVSSFTGNTKSLPPSPQHTPTRKSSIEDPMQNPFELVTQHLEALPLECTTLSFEQVLTIAEPILRNPRNEDLMNLAKSSSKHLYANVPPDRRVEKINELLIKLRIALDAETEGQAMLSDAGLCLATTPSRPEAEAPWKSMICVENKSEERVHALSIIMLYLCTGLQHAQGVVLQ
ncbi:PDZ domain-containing protein 8 [Scaptodrosophila lebanonensis]|uniref:PDZ domain-containing protein 8 n=1 Tax=Drosophila lebanonensis TaxID=7225 RepID=A0A6J2TXI5_DROLE|nr:PDZ domain-containing protein 8 [Scaptodrosophila lebanonensis]